MRHRKESFCGAPAMHAPQNLKNFCGACIFMCYKNNFVEHAPLGAPQMIFLPIVVFLVVFNFMFSGKHLENNLILYSHREYMHPMDDNPTPSAIATAKRGIRQKIPRPRPPR
jgi:hypothetical protein